MVLERLEELLQKYSRNPNARLVDYFDLIAGTSTGSILAAIYLCPDKDHKPKFSAKDATNLYISKGKEIFTKQPYYPLHTLYGLFGSKYTNKPLKEQLNHYFDNVQIGELLKPCLITAYDTERRKTIFFNTVSSKKSSERDFLLKDAVLASAAAPTYFPPAFIKSKSLKENCLIDGGVFANNPSMCALVESMKLPNCHDMKEILLLSVSNVSSKSTYEYRKVRHWGLLHWAIPILDILMDANEETVDYQMNKIFEGMNLRDNYIRIEKREKNNTSGLPKMDDASLNSINRLIDIAKELIEEEEENLEKLAHKLILRKSL